MAKPKPAVTPVTNAVFIFLLSKLKYTIKVVQKEQNCKEYISEEKKSVPKGTLNT